MKIRVTDIEWDNKDKRGREQLPTFMDLDLEDKFMDAVADALTDATGWLMDGFKVQILDAEDYLQPK